MLVELETRGLGWLATGLLRARDEMRGLGVTDDAKTRLEQKIEVEVGWRFDQHHSSWGVPVARHLTDTNTVACPGLR